MGTVLIDHWLAGVDRIPIVDDASTSEVREAIRARAGILPTLALEKLVAAASELARNQLSHAMGGRIGVREVERHGVPGLEVLAADRGSGIADPASALRGQPRAEGSLGIGLSAVTRQVDELDVDIRRGAGTCVRIRSFASPVLRSEVGILAQPHPEETTIGDHAIALRDATDLLLAVCDGLGHGYLAREAADQAIAVIAAHREVALDEQLAAAHAALRNTRGAVMSIARLGAQLEHAGVGNITTRLIASDGTARPLLASAGTLGNAFPRRVHVERPNRNGDLLVMFSDGLSTRIDLSHDPSLVRQHPIVIAHDLLRRFGRGTDDALIAVVR